MKVMEKSQMKIIKVGNSAGLRIPKPVLTQAGFNINDPISIKPEGDRIIITKQRPQITIEKLLKNYSGKYDLGEVDWGKPEGEEIW